MLLVLQSFAQAGTSISWWKDFYGVFDHCEGRFATQYALSRLHLVFQDNASISVILHPFTSTLSLHLGQLSNIFEELRLASYLDYMCALLVGLCTRICSSFLSKCLCY